MILTRLNEWPRNRFVCSVDPITLTGLALAAGGAAAGGAALLSKGGSTPTPAAPVAPAQAAPQQAPTGSPSATPAGNQPTFIGAAATPPVQSGQKSLLGQ